MALDQYFESLEFRNFNQQKVYKELILLIPINYCQPRIKPKILLYHYTLLHPNNNKKKENKTSLIKDRRSI